MRITIKLELEYWILIVFPKNDFFKAMQSDNNCEYRHTLLARSRVRCTPFKSACALKGITLHAPLTHRKSPDSQTQDVTKKIDKIYFVRSKYFSIIHCIFFVIVLSFPWRDISMILLLIPSFSCHSAVNLSSRQQN